MIKADLRGQMLRSWMHKYCPLYAHKTKICFTFLILLFAGNSFCQADRTHYTLEGSLNLSGPTGEGGPYYTESALGYNVFIKTDFASRRSWRFTLGAGFLQSHFISRDYSGLMNFKDHERHYYFDYLVIPVGIKISIGSFYIHPEMGATYNFNISKKSYVVDSEMNKIRGPYTEHLSLDEFELNYTTLLTLGYEINVGSTFILTGLKGYFAPHQDYVNTYGIGLMVGLKI